MEWKKLGLIFDPTNHNLEFNCSDYAQSPQTLVFDNFIRVYFSTREKDKSGQYLSKIAFIDLDKDYYIINYSKKEVISLGQLGCFDEHGIFPFSPLRHEQKILAYTCGWSRRVSVAVETSTGLVESNDNGETFVRIGTGPVLTSSLNEPVLVGDSCVRFFNNKFHMWYIFGKYWLKEVEKEPPARVYKIAHAISENGMEWRRNDGKAIISDVLGEHECQALPTVIKINDIYHMYFCYRYATDFRKNKSRGYRLGYAYSHDLKDWIRNDKQTGIDVSINGWDSEMMCYPHIFSAFGKILLIYNGNQFGKCGFGLAELNFV